MPSTGASAKDRSPNFDRLSFIKHMKDIGRAYRKRATELISICRLYVQVGERSVSQDADLRNILEVVDEALRSAVGAEKKTSEGADKEFGRAINELGAYEQKYHPKNLIVDKKMTSAKEKDEYYSRALNKLEQYPKTEPVEGPMKEVLFLLPGSRRDNKPEEVYQVLCGQSNEQEILWNFNRLKKGQRITLKQNPRFYKDLPELPDEFSGKYEALPLKERFYGESKIWVLTDKQSRVFLEMGENKWVFGNFWVPCRAIVFKDISGKLEGEGIVANYIQGTPNLWHRDESTEIPLPPTTDPANPSDTTGRVFDWRQLIRNTLDSPNISIYISTKCTPPEAKKKRVRSSPTNPAPVPTAHLQTPEPQKTRPQTQEPEERMNWFRKHIWDYKKRK